MLYSILIASSGGRSPPLEDTSSNNSYKTALSALSIIHTIHLFFLTMVMRTTRVTAWCC